MPLMTALGYEIEPPTGLRRRFVEFASNEVVSAFFAKNALPIDKLVLRATSGRSSATALLAGFPVLWLTTTGAKSKQPRQVPLLGIPTPSRNLAVLGTNFGGERTPGWVHNLVVHPDAVAQWRDNTAQVTAVQLEPEQQEPIWETAVTAYPGYARYRERANHRAIRVFELVRRDG